MKAHIHRYEKKKKKKKRFSHAKSPDTRKKNIYLYVNSRLYYKID